MSNKEDKIKVLIGKARRGDVRELPSLIRAFSRWLRSSLAEELTQPSVRRLIESFLHNLNKLVRKIEKIEDLYWKTKSVEILSRLVETIYNTTDSGMSIKYIERIVPEIERVHEDQTVVKSLGDIIGLLGELPQKTTVESPSGNNRKLSPTRKKRAGCLKAGPPPPPKPPLPEEEKRKKKKKTTDSLRDTGKDKEMPQPVDQKGATGPLGGGVSKEIAKKKKTKKKVKKKKKSEKLSPVTFRAHWQSYTVPKTWTDLQIYLYSGLGEEKAAIDLEERIQELETLGLSTTEPVPIKQGTEILVKPEMPGFSFSPEECKVKWYEDFIPVTFRMITEFGGALPRLGKKVDGQVNFFVGPLLITEIDLSVIVKEHLSGDEKLPESRRASAPYQKIFASYAHEDSDIVEIIEEAYSAFGNKYMRDFVTLRSGEEWQPAILKLIKQADVFHLFWSEASKESYYVKEELNAALKRRKKNFIRPVFWETPMPKPLPSKLRKIHFKKIEKMVQRLTA